MTLTMKAKLTIIIDGIENRSCMHDIRDDAVEEIKAYVLDTESIKSSEIEELP